MDIEKIRALRDSGGYLEAHLPNGGLVRLVQGANDNWDFFGVLYNGSASGREDDLEGALRTFAERVSKTMSFIED